MSNYTIKDCKKLIGEASLPYRIIRVNHIYRLMPVMPAVKKTDANKRVLANAVMAEAITDVDALYAKLTKEAVILEDAIAEIEAKRVNLAGLSDEELAKHMSKPKE
jgi:hypothetical protein